jgi:hypothetical protein
MADTYVTGETLPKYRFDAVKRSIGMNEQDRTTLVTVPLPFDDYEWQVVRRDTGALIPGAAITIAPDGLAAALSGLHKVVQAEWTWVIVTLPGSLDPNNFMNTGTAEAPVSVAVLSRLKTGLAQEFLTRAIINFYTV